MKYYLPTHCDVENRGCEAITKATSQILGTDKTSLILLSKNIKQDCILSVNLYSYIYQLPSIGKLKWLYIKLLNLTTKNKYKKRTFVYSVQYNSFLSKIKKSDIMLSTGGDMFCYDDNEAVYTSLYLQKKNIPTILWGCSIGENDLSPKKIETLKLFKIIYVRESLSKCVLEKLGLKNVYLFPDPAFILKEENFILPFYFNKKNDFIGINISNFVLGGFSLDTKFAKSILNLIDHILTNTQLNIILFPHVFWKEQDDRIVSNMIWDKYKKTNRLFVFDSINYNYCQLRFAISKCRFFIGARTHSVISAYSMCVPTIALGYSIKAEGIAKDLGLSPRLVVNCKNSGSEDLVGSFEFLLKNEIAIKQHLNNIMPSYRNKVYGIRDIIKSLIK